MTTKLNGRFLCLVLVAAGALGFGVHRLHAFQCRRTAPVLVEMASREEAEGRPGQALRLLGQYLLVVPEDADVGARHGLLFAKLARTPDERLQAFLALDQVVRRTPDRTDVRRRAAGLAMELQRYSEAEEHLKTLISASPNDGELELQLGHCLEASEHYGEAAACYGTAAERAPKLVDAYTSRASLLRRRLNRPEEADRVMDELVRANDGDFQAYLARGRYRAEFVSAQSAMKDVEKARALAPDNADVLLGAAVVVLGRGGKEALEEARSSLARGVELYPGDERLVRSLAVLDVRSNRPAEAEACLRRCLETASSATRVDLYWDLAELLTDRGSLQEADEFVERLRDAAVPQHLLDFLDARIAAGRGHWREAVAFMERARPGLQGRPDLAERADLLVGHCYERLARPQDSYAAYRRAADADPKGEAACLGTGAALESLGRADEALEIYHRIGATLPRVRLREVRLLIQRNRKLEPAEQHWQEIGRALDEAGKQLPDEIEVPILRAELLRATGKGDQALQLLKAARDRQRERVELWLALAALAEREGKTEAALTVLDEAERQFQGSIEVRLARANFWARQDPKAARAALNALARGADALRGEERDRLRKGLATAYALIGAAKEAAGLWAGLAEHHPDDPDIRLNLFEAELSSAGPDAAKATLDELARIDGPEGEMTRYARARLLLARVKRGEGKGLAEARTLLEAVAVSRPSWGRVELCRAQLAEAEGDPEGAITHYQEAVEEGEQGPAVLRRLTQLLVERRRYAEADRVVALLPDKGALARELRRGVAEAARLAGDPARAAQLAEQAVPADSKDYRDHLWLGQMLFSAGKNDRAELRLRRALDLSEPAADPWVDAVVIELRAGRKARAEELTEEAARRLTGPGKDLALAQCYEAVGQPERARQRYESALGAHADDPAVLWPVVKFHLRVGEPAKAEPLLRRLVSDASLPADQAARARRMLAVVLASQGDFRKTRQALVYLDLVEDKGPPRPGSAESPDDVRVAVYVLAMQRTRPMRQRAIRLLEYLEEHDRPSPDDHFFLAQLYEAVGDWPKARERMLGLLAERGDDAGYLTYFTRGLVRRGAFDEAKPWLLRLEAVRPEALQTLELRCRVLKAEGRGREAAEVLKGYASKPGADLERAGSLLEELEDAAAAESVFRRLADAPGQPENRLVLAAFLARHDRLPEALDLCEAARGSCPTESVAVVSVAALSAARWHEAPGRRMAVQYSAPWDDKQGRRVEAWLEEVVAKDTRQNAVRSALAALRSLQGRYADAEALYRDILRDNPDDPLASNNLAWLLAMSKDRSRQALDLLTHAEELTGPLPELMETRAVVHLSRDEAEPAVSLLEEVIAENPGPVAYFHLARAYRMAGHRDEALEALSKARDLGLRPARLHPQERAILEQMTAKPAAS